MVASVFFGTMLCKRYQILTADWAYGCFVDITHSMQMFLGGMRKRLETCHHLLSRLGNILFIASHHSLDSQPMHADPIRSPDDRRHNTFLRSQQPQHECENENSPHCYCSSRYNSTQQQQQVVLERS